MSGRYLFDTNIVIALFANEAVVIDALQQTAEIFIPSVVIGELYYGAQNSNRVMENLSQIDEFVAENVILACDAATAKQYGAIKNNLRQRGKPIPEMIFGLQRLRFSMIWCLLHGMDISR